MWLNSKWNIIFKFQKILLEDNFMKATVHVFVSHANCWWSSPRGFCLSGPDENVAPVHFYLKHLTSVLKIKAHRANKMERKLSKIKILKKAVFIDQFLVISLESVQVACFLHSCNLRKKSKGYIGHIWGNLPL